MGTLKHHNKVNVAVYGGPVAGMDGFCLVRAQFESGKD